MTAKANTTQPNAHYKIHWHVLVTHAPLSLFGTSFGFQILHLFMYPDCFELASTVTLIGATLMLPPTMITGWWTWKKKYGRAKTKIFKRKIALSFVILAMALIISGWRLVNFQAFLVEPWGLRHWIFLLGIILLIAGALIEGYFGGRLSHR